MKNVKHALKNHFFDVAPGVGFCLLLKPHGTVIQVTLDVSPAEEHRWGVYRHVVFDFWGGLASGSEGHYDWPVCFEQRSLVQNQIEQFAQDLADQFFREEKHEQPTLFQQGQ